MSGRRNDRTEFLSWPPPQGSDEQDFTEAVVSAIHRTEKGPSNSKASIFF